MFLYATAVIISTLSINILVYTLAEITNSNVYCTKRLCLKQVVLINTRYRLYISTTLLDSKTQAYDITCYTTNKRTSTIHKKIRDPQ